MKNPKSHIPFEKLTDLAEGRIPTERENLMVHVAECSSCSADFDRLSNVINLMRSDTAADAPRDLIAHAVNMFQSRSHASEPSLLRRIVAALSFDSFTAAPAFGMRSGQSPVRQLLFETDEGDLDIRVESRADGLIVSGQVLGHTCAGGQVALEGVAHSAAATLNDVCEFKFSSVPAGSYSLRVSLSHVELEIPLLELGG